MLLGLSYQLIRFIADLVLVRTRSDAQLRAEVLALRHQLRVDLRATRSEMTGRGLTADHQPRWPKHTFALKSSDLRPDESTTNIGLFKAGQAPSPSTSTSRC